MKDYYQILGITHNATTQDIKKAFWKAALLYHPDKNPSTEAKIKFQEATEAYEVLREEASRYDYDKAFLRNLIDEVLQEKMRFWAAQGHQKSREYASLDWQKFAQRLVKETKLGLSYLPNAIAMLFAAMSMLTFLIMPFTMDDASPGIFIMSFISFILSFFLMRRLYRVAKKDYLTDRNHKF